jgi:hypothetical protein
MLLSKRRRSAASWGRRCLLSVTALAALSVIIALPRTSRAAPAKEKVEIDPKALATLARTTAYLRSLSAFKISAEVTRDEVVLDDFKLQRASKVEVSVRRPDRLRAEVSGDQGARLFVYDGKRLNVYAKDESYYGSFEAPPSVREMLDTATQQQDVEMPLVDVIYTAMGGELIEGLLDADQVGLSVVDGTECVQLAFRGPKVDWQLWVEQGSKPVPRKLVITTTDDPTRPQYSVIMHWDTAPSLSDERFTFSPPEGALPMSFDPAKVAAKNSKPTKAKAAP